MEPSNAARFVTELGPLFAGGFLFLTTVTLYHFAQVRDLARSVTGDDWVSVEAEAALETSAARAWMAASSIPTLALIGRVASADLGSGDPLALLNTLMDGGVATALATTVCGQALYLVVGQVWAFVVAAPYEAARARLRAGPR